MAAEPGDELRAVIDELRAMQPCPLLGSSINGVRLWAWAEDVAARLLTQLPALGIVVGYLRYPDRMPDRQVDFDAQYRRMPVLDATRVGVSLDGPLAVARGHDGQHQLMITNRSGTPVTVRTNGRVTAHVVDPSTGRVAGISTMAQTQPLVLFRAEPSESVAIPLVVGTASVDPELGFAVPAGTWGLQATVQLAEDESSARRDCLTPPLGFEIV